MAASPEVLAQSHQPFELTRPQKVLTLLGVLLGMLLAALDQTIVSTAGPAIQKDLHIPASLYAWITTAYLVASTVLVPVYGKLSDAFGRQAHPRHRHRHLPAGLGAVRPVADDAPAHPRPCVAGRRLRVALHQRVRHRRGHLPALRARQVPGPLRRRVRTLQRGGAAGGRLPHGPPELALGVLRQPARGRGGARLHPRPHAAAAPRGAQGLRWTSWARSRCRCSPCRCCSPCRWAAAPSLRARRVTRGARRRFSACSRSRRWGSSPSSWPSAPWMSPCST